MTTTQPWHDLPNAAQIARVVTHWNRDPEPWRKLWNVYIANDQDGTGIDSLIRATAVAKRLANRQHRHQAMGWALNHLGGAARMAVYALIAWDDCAHLLDTDPEQVQVLALLGQPAAILLYPACRALHETSIKSIAYST